MTSADDWDKVESFFSQGLSAGPEERDQLLSTADPALARQVRKLWNDWRQAGTFLQTPLISTGSVVNSPEALQGAPLSQQALAGKPFGPYEVVRLVGEGGMGVVFEARRTDGEFERTVAIKVLKLGTLSPSLLKRFTRERQLLAQLNHPNIAVLIDGGTSNDGFPYLAAEFVPGEPIDTYCNRMELTVNQRLRLILKVCSAVAHAHSKLIVHQDLKPSNILVTPDGTPKLLDFGIAKSLDPSDDGRTTNVHTLFATPRYASPEQLAGLPVTTATDVYALGVIAYELLTGRTPDTTTDRFSEPVRPSSAAPQNCHLSKERSKADIDTIILKAIQKCAEDRYQTVIEFAADIELLLAGQPIHSRPNTIRYRTAKFLLRHPVGVSASAVAILLLMLSTVFSLYEARIADRRSAIIRRIANSLIVETNEDLSGLPGAIAARKALVSRSLRFLEELKNDGGTDAATLSDVAYAYLKIGKIQGGLDGYPTQGSVKLGLESFKRAAVLLEQARALQPHDELIPQRLIDVYTAVSASYLSGGQLSDALRYSQRAMSLSALYARASKSDKATLSSGSSAFQYAAILAGTGDYIHSLPIWKTTLSLYQGYAASHPAKPLLQRNVALVHKRTGAVLMMLKRYPEALAEYQAAVLIDEKILALAPHDPTRQLDLSFDYVDPAEIYILLHQPAEALRCLQRAIQIREAVYQADPMNDRAVSSLASAYSHLADLHLSERHFDLSANAYERAIKLYESEKQAGKPRSELVEIHFRAGNSFQALGSQSNCQKALAHYRAALTLRLSLSAAAATVIPSPPSCGLGCRSNSKKNRCLPLAHLCLSHCLWPLRLCE